MRRGVTWIPVILFVLVCLGCFKVQVPVKEVADVTKSAYKAAKDKFSTQKEVEAAVESNIDDEALLRMVREILPQLSKTAQSIDRNDPMDIIAIFAKYEGYTVLSEELNKRQVQQAQ